MRRAGSQGIPLVPFSRAGRPGVLTIFPRMVILEGQAMAWGAEYGNPPKATTSLPVAMDSAPVRGLSRRTVSRPDLELRGGLVSERN